MQCAYLIAIPSHPNEKMYKSFGCPESLFNQVATLIYASGDNSDILILALIIVILNQDACEGLRAGTYYEHACCGLCCVYHKAQCVFLGLTCEFFLNNIFLTCYLPTQTISPMSSEKDNCRGRDSNVQQFDVLWRLH